MLVMMFVSTTIAQGDMMTREEKLVGSSTDFSVGIHSGIFDCNQEYDYPFNIGLVGQYNYTPNVMKNWFIGGEAGVFFTQSPEDGNFREMGAIVGHVSLFPGYSINLDKKEFPEEDDFNSKLNSKKLNLGLGLTLGVPIKTYSSGSTYHEDNADTGFGFSGFMSYDVSRKLNIFGSVSRVGADMDGFGYDPETDDRTIGNDYKVSYWGKIGIAYNLFVR